MKSFKEHKDKLILELLQKCEDFVDIVIPEYTSERKNNEQQSVIWLEYRLGSKTVFDITITLNYDKYEDRIFIDESSIKKEYFSLRNYMNDIFGKFLKKDDFYFTTSNLTEKIINNIEFDIEDYEIFKDSERFGL